MMHIAVIEDDPVIREKLKSIIPSEDWLADFYVGTDDFGQADLSDYDVILSDQSLAPIDGRKLLGALSKKTKAELLLMHDGTFSEVDIYNDHIKGLIDKTDIANIIDKLQYILVKLRIQKLAVEENISFNGMQENSAFTVNNLNGVATVDILDINEDSEKIHEFFDTTEKDIILTFSKLTYLTSMHLGMIVSTYNRLKKHHKKIVYWNKNKSSGIKDIFRDCKLNLIVPIFEDLETAKEYLHLANPVIINVTPQEDTEELTNEVIQERISKIKDLPIIKEIKLMDNVSKDDDEKQLDMKS
jgi:anti-anti-sigma regulatory factor